MDDGRLDSRAHPESMGPCDNRREIPTHLEVPWDDRTSTCWLRATEELRPLSTPKGGQAVCRPERRAVKRQAPEPAEQRPTPPADAGGRDAASERRFADAPTTLQPPSTALWRWGLRVLHLFTTTLRAAVATQSTAARCVQFRALRKQRRSGGRCPVFSDHVAP